jgi:hypothetical protein
VRLGERLLELGLLSAEALDEALGAQMAYGGRLGTNLVELFHLDLDALAGALGNHHGRPPATAEHFARLDRAVQAELPVEVAARWHAVPLFRDGGVVAVATTDPLPGEGVDELAEHLGGCPSVLIAPELRLLYHLEQAYGVQRTNRFRRIARPDAPRDARRRYVETLSDADEPPEPPSLLARIAVKKIPMVWTGEHELGDDTSTLDAAIKAMRRATGRERLGDLAVGAIANGFGHAFSAAMVLSLRREVLFGWRGFVRDADRHLIEAVALPLAEPSLLRGPVSERRLFAGPPPDGGSALDHKLWLLLRTGPPVEVAVVPLELRGKVIGALYAHSEGPIPPDAVGGLAEIGQALVAGFDRLLRGLER